MVDSSHAVLFGGYSDGKGRMDDLYILDLAKMVRMSSVFVFTAVHESIVEIIAATNPTRIHTYIMLLLLT